jgi:hypothetical protein
MLGQMGGMWWPDVESFARALRSANEEQLRQMYDWAHQRERDADRPGQGRNPKARRFYRQMRVAAEEHLDERGLLWG